MKACIFRARIGTWHSYVPPKLPKIKGCESSKPSFSRSSFFSPISQLSQLTAGSAQSVGLRDSLLISMSSSRQILLMPFFCLPAPANPECWSRTHRPNTLWQRTSFHSNLVPNTFILSQYRNRV